MRWPAFLRRMRDERGTALATVLVMVSIMSALAVAVTDAASMSLRRTSNQSEMEQARWYLLGAEQFAINRIGDLIERNSEMRIDQSEWQGKPVDFPLDEGVLRLTLWDGSNCFNLNGLVSAGDSNGFGGDAAGQVQFARLLDLLNVRSESATSLAAALTDWIDSDANMGPGGAEASAYAHEPYTIADTLMADMSELERVRGFDQAIAQRLAPYVCVRPMAGANALNVNTLLPHQAPLLAMVLGGDFSAAAAEEAIRTRPRGGWDSVDDFFGSARLSALELTPTTQAYFTTQSRYFVAVMQVQRRGASESAAVLLEAGGGRVRVIRRVFGAGDWEHAV